MSEDTNQYDSEEFETAFFDEEKALEYIKEKQIEMFEISSSKDYKRYKKLSDAGDDRDLTTKEDTEIKLLGIQFNDFTEKDWFVREIDIEDSKQYFREKKLDYLFNE